MKYPPDRHGDNRWNTALDLLIETWNKLGPDFTVSYLRMSARAEIDSYGMVQMEMAGARQVREDAATRGREPLSAAAERAYAEGRLKPLPRMPTVRPESDYEMNLPGEAG